MTRRLLLALAAAIVVAMGAVQAQAQDVADQPIISKGYAFSGKWMPDVDSTLIGPENFRTLTNLRYTDASISGVLGYSKINTTALAKPLIRNGHQLFTNGTDTFSHVFVQAANSTGSSSVYINSAQAPDAGNFTATAIHDDATGAGLGRFAAGPQGSVIYCNGAENRIWGGNETALSGFFTVDNASLANPKDHTEAVRNTLETDGNYASVTATQRVWVALSSRALAGVRYELKTANAAAATTAAAYWNGTAFAAVTGWSDGTSSGGVSLAQDGWMRFTSTATTAKPMHFQGRYLYAYRFTISSGSAEIAHVEVDAPFQALTDVWDGVERQNIGFHVSRNGTQDTYTEETNEKSSVQYPIAALIGNCTSSDHVTVMFSRRQTAMKWSFIAGQVNNVASDLTLYTWNGAAWATAENLTDGTDNGTCTMAQDGLISWAPPAETAEFKTTLYGETGYAYKLVFNATLRDPEKDGTGVAVDTVTGIPAPDPPGAAKFAATFRGRVMLCNFEASKEQNRIDFSFPDSPDIWNGDLTSDGGSKSLYVGSGEPIVAATEIFNRIGNAVSSMFLILKKTETFLLQGDSPETWTLHTVSKSVGCAAPLTLTTCEMGYDMAEGVQRNVALWLSYSGPMMYDGVVLQPIPGVKKYFDPSEDECVNYAALDGSGGWYDSTNREYNLLIPSGSGQTTNNVWLVYDLGRKKWFQKDTGDAEFPQVGWAVQDDSGARYCYSGADDGHVRRLENGTSWDGLPIAQTVETGDFLFGDAPWDITCIRYVKVLASRISEQHTLSVYHVADTAEDGIAFNFVDTTDFEWKNTEYFTWSSGSSLAMDLSLTTSSAAIVKDTEPSNLIGLFHRLRFSVSTSDTKHGFRPIGYALQGYVVREDK